MKQNLAKRYVKAVAAISEELVVKTYSDLKVLTLAFDDANFKDALLSTTLTKEQKLDVVKSVAKSEDTQVNNLLSLLSENGRLAILPQIIEELRYNTAILTNKYEGVVSSKSGVSSEVVDGFSKALSAKLDREVAFEQKSTNDEVVRVNVEDLDVEMSFSKEQFKAQLSNHILQAI
jgi:F-type H+-transporting ATPase subunit delta